MTSTCRRWLIRRTNDAAWTVCLTEDMATFFREGSDKYEVEEVVPAEQLAGVVGRTRERVMALGGFQRAERGEFWVSRDDVLRLLDEL